MGLACAQLSVSRVLAEPHRHAKQVNDFSLAAQAAQAASWRSRTSPLHPLDEPYSRRQIKHSVVRRCGTSRRVMARSPAAGMVRVRVARGSGRGMPAGLPVLAIGLVCGEALDDAIARQHAAVDAEVAAHHEGPHGGVLARQLICLVGQVGLILAAVDQYQAGVPGLLTVAFVGWGRPSTSLAEACRKRSCISTQCPDPRFRCVCFPGLDAA